MIPPTGFTIRKLIRAFILAAFSLLVFSYCCETNGLQARDSQETFVNYVDAALSESHTNDLSICNISELDKAACASTKYGDLKKLSTAVIAATPRKTSGATELTLEYVAMQLSR
jgi:hypothetical protein